VFRHNRSQVQHLYKYMNTASAPFPIRVLASITGVSPTTLRAWERRYGLVRPARTAKGHRLYTHQHVEIVRRAMAMVERGVAISQVRGILDAEPGIRETGRAKGPWRAYQEQMVAAIVAFDEVELDRNYELALSVHAIDTTTQRLILPLLAHLGERWSRVQGAVAEEHFFASYLRSKLGARMQHQMRYASGPRLVAACPPGERHEIGLLLFALQANVSGMRTILLGADTPLPDILLAQRRTGAAGIVLSMSGGLSGAFLDTDLPDLVDDSEVPVFVGGAAAAPERNALAAAGAVALGQDLQASIELIQGTVGARRRIQ
jgi:MerR family transcriptional regulator, light-induced transcriptional regulator